MGTGTAHTQLELGDVVLDRLKDYGKIPSSLRPYVASVTAEQKKLRAASDTTTAKRVKRDDALKVVGDADDVLDGLVDELANGLVGANITKRGKPLDGLSSYAVSRLKELAYATEVKEVTKVLVAARKLKPPANVVRVMAKCAAQAAKVSKALAALRGPQAGFQKSLAERDALLPDWDKAYRKLRLLAQAVWVDEPATFSSIFAPPSALEAPKKRRKKKDNPVAPTTPADNGTATMQTKPPKSDK